ncbi:MAG: ankyrin repeat domain-containing protein [Pirellulaceae bacterium]|nr:ankyrin repeat domain-containing protein [Pirellulaceae bacterium]
MRMIHKGSAALVLLVVPILLLAHCAAACGADAPLADAAERQDAAAVRAGLNSKAEVNAPQADGMTALHWASYHDDADLVQRLLSAGAEVNATNRYGVPPLSLACTNGNGAIVERLLAAGADPNAALPGGETPLMTAARTGRIEPVRALLARGAKVNARERQQQTALMWAAAEGNTEVVAALLEAGADFREPLASGFTPLFFAIRESRGAVVRKLLAAGADINAPLRPERGGKAFTPLTLAVENGHFELAADLLKAGADPNLQPAGYAALHALTWVRKPIRGDGDPPPIGSGSLGSLDLVRELVARGAEVNIRLQNGESGRGRFTTTGSTPFLLAARTGDVPLMRLLLELGADPKLANAVGSPPLLAAAGVGALAAGDEAAATEDEALVAIALLLDLGADINAVDKNGETAMHGAAYQSLPKVVELLVERRADIAVWNRENKWGWTPLLIAQGHRPGNFRPAPETIAALERAMRDAGVKIPPPRPPEIRRRYP